MLKITTLINKIPVWIGVLLLLCLNYLGFHLHGNEEMYLLLAKQFYQPDFITNSFNLTQSPSNRLLYQYIAGYCLEYLSFEQTALLGRAVLCFLFAFPIAKIIKKFELSLIEGLFILQVFFFANQAFFADSWIFLSFEAKCISYVFILWGLYALLKNRLLLTVLCLVIATWFHVLVGGWTFIMVFIYMIFQRATFKQLLGRGFLYTILVAPLIWYLAQEILLNSETVLHGVNMDWIYTYYRNPHHTVLSHYSFTGIGMMIVWGITCLAFFTKLEQDVLKRINLFNLVAIGVMMVFLGVAWFDENGTFTKFYLFRFNSTLKFFLIFEVAMVLKLWVVQRNFLPYINAVLLLFLIPHLFTPVNEVVHSYDKPETKELLWDDFTQHIRLNTPKDAVFLVYNGKKDGGGDGDISFNRKTERERFVIYKIVPSGGEQIHDWYERMQEKNKLAGHLDYLPELNKKYRVDYLVSKWRLQRENLVLKYSNEGYFLYKIIK